MANAKPEYFIPTTWDFPPDGPIALGSVITSLKKPHRRLALCPPNDDDILPSSKLSVSVSKEKLRSGGFSILTTFLSGLLGLGVDVGADWKKSNEKAFTFDRMDTTQFIPTPAYLKRCIESPSVHPFLETSRFRKPVYIITGIKIVSGAQGATKTSRSVDGMVGAQVDGTVLSGGVVPVGGGPEIRRGRGTKSVVEWKGSSDFVFAYKVSEVRVSRAGEVKREREYTKGAIYEDGVEMREADTLVPALVECLSVNLEGGFDAEGVEEGGVVVTYGVPVLVEEESD